MLRKQGNEYNLIQSAADFRWEVRANSTASVFAGITISTNLWYFVCGTYDGTTETIYVAGVNEGTNGNTGNIQNNDNKSLTVGSNNNPLETFWNGRLAYASVWDVTLTETQVNEEMRRPFIIPDSQLSKWPIWGTDSPEIDLSGNGRTGTITEAAEFFDGPPVMLGDAPI